MPAKCVLSVSSDIQVQCTHTPDGAINLLIQQVNGVPGGIDISAALCHDSLWTFSESHDDNTRSITFCVRSANRRANTKPAGAATNELSPDKAVHSEDSYTDDADEHGDGHDDSEGENSEDVENEVTEGGDADLNGRFRKLREKLGKHWKTTLKTIHENLSTWTTDPSTFFGGTEFPSSETWSFKSLCDSDAKFHKFRSPFHKVNLANRLKRCIEHSKKTCPGILELNCRRTMLGKIYPDLQKMTRSQRRALHKKFQRYINQGNALKLILQFDPGVFLAIARHLSTKDLDFLSKVLRIPFSFELLDPQKQSECEKFRDVVSQIFGYMQSDFAPHTPKRQADQSPQDSRRYKRPRLPPTTNDVVPVGRIHQSTSLPMSTQVSQQQILYQEDIANRVLARTLTSKTHHSLPPGQPVSRSQTPSTDPTREAATEPPTEIHAPAIASKIYSKDTSLMNLPTTFDFHAFDGQEHELDNLSTPFDYSVFYNVEEPNGNSVSTPFDYSVFHTLEEQYGNGVPTPFDYCAFFFQQQEGNNNLPSSINDAM